MLPQETGCGSPVRMALKQRHKVTGFDNFSVGGLESLSRVKQEE